ncbi:MAG: hypothetical protein Q8T11_06945, partial [Elusimicrobiota bacterium]|nr:hypothetical protein [Elusimicrobiota bacterium]
AAGGGWLSSMLASLTATVMGKAILAAGAAMFLGGAGLFGYAMLNGGGAGAGGYGDLGAIASSMKIRSGDVDRTGYIASKGEIMFDPIKAAAAKKAEAEKAPEEQTAEAPVMPEQIADGDASGLGGRPGLENNLSGAKLSSSLGGGFGGKNIFAGSNAAPKFNEGLSKTTIKGAAKGRLTASKNARTGRRVAGGSGKQVRGNRAFGQLKVAKGMSALGAGTSAAEGARSSAATAFDGSTPGGSNIEGGPGVGTGAVDTPSGPGGAPDVTAPNVDIPEGVGMDPNSLAMIAAIAEMAKQAGDMKKKAAMLMIVGIALMAAGAASLPWGAILIAIGGMLVGMSVMMSQMAEMMKGMADSMSQGLAARTGDTKQDEINKYCIDKAYNEGTDPKNCNPPDTVTENSRVTEENTQAVEEVKDKNEKDAETKEVENLERKEP